MDARLEIAEGKAAKSLEGTSRSEQKLAQLDSSIESLHQQDEAIGERTRVTADGITRLEGVLDIYSR